MDGGVLVSIAEQLPMAVLTFLVVVWILRRQDLLDKIREESRERERLFQASEAEKQRDWNEDQGKKRDEFQRELITHTNTFIKGLQEDQKKSINLLNESIQLVSSKTDLVLHTLNQHHSFSEKKIDEITKWKDGIEIRRKVNAE